MFGSSSILGEADVMRFELRSLMTLNLILVASLSGFHPRLSAQEAGQELIGVQALLNTRDALAWPSSPKKVTRTSGAVAGVPGASEKIIVIGFVGGFARHDDRKHPEVQFAEYLRERYRSGISVEVFGNHHGRKALRHVLRLLDTDGNGSLSVDEKQRARIVLYGHSWGAAETLVFARELDEQGIHVLLTIQVDSIAKPGHNDSTIPDNVKQAINFYQSRGPLHGRSQIFAADPARTVIIGNIHLTYQNISINCDNYPWYARTSNRPHHEIENDPRVWNLAASLIQSEFTGMGQHETQRFVVQDPRSRSQETTPPYLSFDYH